MTDEHAMKVWREALGDYSRNPIGSKYDLDMADQAAAAVIAADRAALVARIEELEGALADMLHAVCHETGFVAAVRADSGLAYPWEPLDMAEAKARAALKDTHHD